ncbi:DUF1330 domain-containing protein [Providencia vermicola]|uniref:DUF1330 domain-containing protein n=1 Tax=Providencia TaxID=586 RepID=UPI0012B587A7|nr:MULTISPECIES: DUF1330 domain-containing protein [Providencia]ELR5142266.1 DUF1330 domain-containing protein [Providencia stuartii]MTB38982.1 DUF1330 domain-containing protein [Providencia sp. wls1949]MTC08035.1 DUF1330 domain-containing protein [Providencia sp. wls1948]QIC17146.1 DUF1330 domain-containing protein [Providencia vermicola]WER21693.1 DUF1330 domain-containing protein [Providencia stuartii]
MPAYWIAHVTVFDTQKYPQYMQLAATALQKYQGKFLARGENAITLEGKTYEKHVVIEFKDYETALSCYHSIEYQNAYKQRKDIADVMVIIVNSLTS